MTFFFNFYKRYPYIYLLFIFRFFVPYFTFFLLFNIKTNTHRTMFNLLTLSKENILFLFSSIILSYLVLQYHMKTINKKFWIYLIFLTLFFYIFFVSVSSDSLFTFQEKFTNGLDDEESGVSQMSGSSEVSGTTEMSGISQMSGGDEEISEDEMSAYIPPSPTPTPSPSPTELSGASTTDGGEQTTQPSEMSGISSSEMSGKGDDGRIDMNNIIFDRATTGNAYGPLNINVSYKMEGCNGDKPPPHCNPKNPYVDNIGDNGDSSNLGKYNYKSRVHNNKSWMNTWEESNYGKQAWTLDPDYYIPPAGESVPPPPQSTQPIHPRPQFQNELNYRYNKTKEKCAVCPLEINTPWSEYKTGDKEPEGFNL